MNQENWKPVVGPMLSLNKLKSIEVKVVDNELPVAVYDQVEISDEDGYETEQIETGSAIVRNEIGIAMLVRMFKIHIANKKQALKEKFTAAWAHDMERLINDNGLTKHEFLQCLNQ